ncbi:hypothetical protein ES703_109852 [subsurface metagenome]
MPIASVALIRVLVLNRFHIDQPGKLFGGHLHLPKYVVKLRELKVRAGIHVLIVLEDAHFGEEDAGVLAHIGENNGEVLQWLAGLDVEKGEGCSRPRVLVVHRQVNGACLYHVVGCGFNIAEVGNGAAGNQSDDQQDCYAHKYYLFHVFLLSVKILNAYSVVLFQ